MKEEIKSVKNSDESHQNKKSRLQKQRMIRKAKLKVNDSESVNTDINTSANLSREERARIQKIKNRQAAQKSRQTHKQYVIDLQQEIIDLKNNLEHSKRYCSSCQKEIVKSEEEKKQENPQTKVNFAFFQFQHQNEQNHLKNIKWSEENSMNEKQNLDEFMTYQRINSQESQNYLGTMFFILILVLAIIIPAPNHGSSEALSISPSKIAFKRQLLVIDKDDIQQKQNKPNLQMIEDKTKNQNLLQTKDNDKMLATLSQNLKNMNDEDCFKLLLKVPSSFYTMSSIGIEQARHMQAFARARARSQRRILAPTDMLLCQMPMVYRAQGQRRGFLTKFIEIVLNGAQIHDVLVGSTTLLPPISLSGLYKINAEVKSIIQINDGNCLL